MLLFSLVIVESDGRSGSPGDAGHRPRAATHQPAGKRQPSGWPLFHRWRASASVCDASSIAARTPPAQQRNKGHENNNIFPNGLLDRAHEGVAFAASGQFDHAIRIDVG